MTNTKLVENRARPKPPNAGKGRPKGSPNKTTALLKDAILKAAEKAGNSVGDEGLVSYLEHQATENPGPFMSLLGKVLPMQVTGEDGNSLEINVTIGGHD
ncbi:hypothetical protein [Maritalea porphyrae]|uniref:hypothetical protein n=1 Tax=Maritalea porphyrae TaxID=880732 RepID=UPI0022B07670|nr:hypothetical protein [Maritalea porphyrae]MCZ4270899.1 hypothetical protein [Maritalea porphyrae]